MVPRIIIAIEDIHYDQGTLLKSVNSMVTYATTKKFSVLFTFEFDSASANQNVRLEWKWIAVYQISNDIS